MKILFAPIFALLLFVCSPAIAADTLQTRDVERFVSSIDDIDQFARDMENEGKDDVLAAEPIGASFAPYTSSIEPMKNQYPADYQRLGSIVSTHGFSSVEEWASVGDSVMLTYIAMKMERENPEFSEMASQITPEMMAMMPPEAQAQMQQSLMLMDAISDVPASNKQVVGPFMPQLDAWAD